MEFFLQQTVNGLTLGCVYALLALGLNLIWGMTGMINLGLAGFFALGAYASALATTSAGLPMVLGLVVAFELKGHGEGHFVEAHIRSQAWTCRVRAGAWVATAPPYRGGRGYARKPGDDQQGVLFAAGRGNLDAPELSKACAWLSEIG